MDVAYLQQTKCVFSFNPIHSSTHNRRVSVPYKVPIINSRDYQHNARRSFRRGSQNMCLASSSDTLVSGKSSSPTVTSKKESEFEEEEDLKSWMHKNGLPPCKVILKDRPAYDSRHPSIHYVAASEDLKAGDVAFSVPSSMLVTLERVLGNETVAELLTTSKLSELACLALYLMYEKNKEKSLSGSPIKVDADDDVITMMQKHIVSDYQHQKGHELVMHVLYHLHAVTVSDSDSSVYDKFLLGVAKCLLDGLPASDKSFSRLFSEAPYLPEAAYKLLDEICSSDNNNNNNNNGDRVTQGLGSLWTLILGRPHDRQAFLDIALKCAVHPKDDIRAKAIRLVANKLYVISFISEKIESFATNKLLSAVNKAASEADQRTQGQMGSEETSISGSQISVGERESDSSVSPAQAQQHLSLFFALCTKKPSLLQLVFDRYDGAPKPVKQAIHRHVPILIRALGASYSDLLSIISDPPQGSENLLTQVLHVLCEGTTPSPDLIATVKRLYETKLKDASILIPILSSFTNKEVLPIFPRLVQLPLDKFQTALAHILQGSAHMGPALTPAQVLVAIHDISPDKDAVPLKKIMDACSACFEQRTVFTQQVLAKALNQMVDQTPLPLLFMRTVIQAMDAFPKLVDFVMELLSKLVSKQVWRMPKLWVGFLKCISQTQPHSFRVLLQLPSPQLEGALNKYSSLRAPLAAYANQPTIKPSLPRSTLEALGLATEAPSFNNNPDKSTKVEGTT